MSTSSSESPSTCSQVDDQSPQMKINPHRATQLLTQITHIQSLISTTKTKHSITKPIRLVAVSKLKPITDILALAQAQPQPQPNSSSSDTTPQPDPQPQPHLHFGENYVQELLSKSKLLPPALQTRIRWHFIGSLQANKARQLARDVPGLWAVESVDSIKKANLLDKGRAQAPPAATATHENPTTTTTTDGPSTPDNNNNNNDADIITTAARAAAAPPPPQPPRDPLRVFVQINTSNEPTKSGLDPKSPSLLNLCIHIRDRCPHLHFQGLMTIGAIARSQAVTTTTTTAETKTETEPENENEDFACLRETRDWVASELGLGLEETGKLELELSMGMSQDFESAIAMGSDEVRVGSTIFGERPPKKEARVLGETEETEETEEEKQKKKK